MDHCKNKGRHSWTKAYNIANICGFCGKTVKIAKYRTKADDRKGCFGKQPS